MKSNTKPLSSKVFAGFLLVVTLMTGLVLFFSFQTIRNRYISILAQNLRNINSAIRPQVDYYLKERNYSSLNSLVRRVGAESDVRVTVILADGTVVADSKRDPATMGNHAGRPEFREALSRGAGESKRYSETLHNEMIYNALPVIADGKILGATRISIFIEQVDQLISKLTIDILKIAAIVILISLIGALLFSRSVSKRLKLLSGASRRVASGDFSVKVSIKGRDEIRELADNFNNMTGQLESLFYKVNSQREEFQSLITSIQEGLVVIDRQGVILLSNNSFNRLFHGRDHTGKHYPEVVGELELAALVNETINTRASYSREIILSGRSFFVSSSYITIKEEIVLLFHDISELKKFEQIKKDFIVNVSHELRTPLTAIKGFIETLEETSENEENLHYIDIIKRHTNRLINIVQDLLILSQVEGANAKLLPSMVNAQELIENVLKIFEQKIEEKGLAVRIEAEEGLPKLKLDTFRFEQVMVNLIDNAIKHTDEGEIVIKIFQDADCVKIQVIDTGSGIAKEDLERIFERFYTVDKSRSRKLGGTGLGLSIVKHIVLQHKGSIDVQSEPGKGSCFTVALPVKAGKAPR
ncbi:MAG: ATP-binding protein [Chloroflexota bacterium]